MADVAEIVSLLISTSSTESQFGVIYLAECESPTMLTKIGRLDVASLAVCDRIIPFVIMFILQTDEFEPHHENLLGYADG